MIFGDLSARPLPSDFLLVKIPADASPYTVHDYDGLWHTAEFSIRISAIDDFTSVSKRAL
jgi:hypothetical protein